MKQFDLTFAGWPPEDIRAISAPTLVVIGDSDVIRPEHAVELFRLLGGGVPGDLAGLPRAHARRPPRHHPRHGRGPRRLAGPDDRRVPRRARNEGKADPQPVAPRGHFPATTLYFHPRGPVRRTCVRCAVK